MATQYGSEKKRGSLMVVGSGIKCVGQITLEAKGWIEQADHVLYLVADPATEIWINQANQDNTNLSLEYKVGLTYDQIREAIVETILEKVREGQDVCAVFYGHPGVLASASGEAIKRARKEGYRAAMLPGVSSVDCLMADLEVDLGVDLAEGGFQIFTALDFVERNLSLNTTCHVVFMRIATLGGPTFYSRSPDGHAFPALVDKLKAANLYGPNHVVTLYQAAKYPTCPPLICRLPLHQLVAEVQKDTSCAFTLYIPPKPTMHAQAAQDALDAAQTALQAARAAYEAAPDALQAAQAAQAAHAALDAAQAALDAARDPFQAAKTAQSAQAAYEAAQAALDKAQAAKAAQDVLDKAQTALDKAKTAHEAAQAKYKKWAAVKIREEDYQPYQPSRDSSQLADYLAELSQNPRQLAAFYRARKALGVPQAELSEKPWLQAGRGSILQEYGRKLTPQELDALLSPTDLDRARNLYQAMQEPYPTMVVGGYTPETSPQNPMKNQGDLQAAIPPDPSGYKDLTQGSDGSTIKWVP